MFNLKVIICINVVIILTTVTIVWLELTTLLPSSEKQPDGCTLSLNNGYDDALPLMLVPESRGLEFLEPRGSMGQLRFEVGDGLRMACPSEQSYIKDMDIYCAENEIFKRRNFTDHPFYSFVCSSPPQSVVRLTEQKCLGKYSTYEIGFLLHENDTELLKTMEICRNDVTMETYYSKANLTKAISYRQRGMRSRIPRWSQGDFWQRYNLTAQYSKLVDDMTPTNRSQVKNTTKHRFASSAKYLNPGFLTPPKYFPWYSAGDSAYWYLNSAPRFRISRENNWDSLESNIIAYAGSLDYNLDVYTGTHGIATLRNSDKVEHPAYLFQSGKEQAIPVPKFFWKIIHDPTTNRGTAFVVVNNPYLEEVTFDYYICNDISDRIKWLFWHPNNVEYGVSYACTVEDLRKVIETVPELRVVDILA